MPKKQSTNKIIDKLDFFKIKTSPLWKILVKRMRRLAADWEKIFSKDTSDKRLLFRTHNELLKLNTESRTCLENEPKIVFIASRNARWSSHFGREFVPYKTTLTIWFSNHAFFLFTQRSWKLRSTDTQREKWEPTPVLLPGKPMDGEAQ